MGSYQPDLAGAPIIFVVGNSRSGTSMMGLVLGRHPGVFTFHELHFFEELWDPTVRETILSPTAAHSLAKSLFNIQLNGYHTQAGTDHTALADALVASLAPEYLSASTIFTAFLRQEAQRMTKRIPCDQTPRNVFYLREILDLIPNALVINMIRDPRDILLSQKQKWKRMFLSHMKHPMFENIRTWVNYNPITISKLWVSSMQAAERVSPHPRIISIYYEKMVAQPELALEQLCQYLGLSFTPTMLQVPQIGSSNIADDLGKKGINTSSVGNWQKGGLSSAEIFLCQWITGSTMTRHGYEPVAITPSLPLLLYAIGTFPLKLLISLLLNLSRMSNVMESLRRRLS